MHWSEFWGALQLLGIGGEFSVSAFILSVVGCASLGWYFGSAQLPGTGMEYLLAALGGLIGIYVGFALAMAATGALIGWLVGWCLWRIFSRIAGVDSDLLFWSPIFTGAGLGAVGGLAFSVRKTLVSLRRVRKRATQRAEVDTLVVSNTEGA